MNRRMVLLKRILALTVIGVYGAVMPSAALVPGQDKALYTSAEQVGTIVSSRIREASGLAASARDRNLLWVINDSGNSAALFAIAVDGHVRAEYIIADTPNCDWEDLAAFSLDRKSYLLIADTGDNLAGRATCTLYIVAEPEVPETPVTEALRLPVEWRIRFRYPEGARDCEAVAVDVRQKRVLLLSKRDKPPVLYELPLVTDATEIEAVTIGPMTVIPQPTAAEREQPYGFSWARPTAMDLSIDGHRLIVLTYKNAYAFDRQPGRSWQSVITEKPVDIPLPHPTTGLLPIREALCIQPETGVLFITGESPPAPVFRLSPLKNRVVPD